MYFVNIPQLYYNTDP